MARDFEKFDTHYEDSDFRYLKQRNNDWIYRGPHHGKGPKNSQRSDGAIQEDICDKLTWDHDVDASEIEVQVANGEVTLTGTVHNWQMRRLAEQNVQSVRGVRQIFNQLRVNQSHDLNIPNDDRW